MQWLFGLMALPLMMGQGKRYFAWQAGMAWLGLCAALVWLAAPFAIWQAFGMAWMLFWLVPSGAAICALGYSRAAGFGGG